ncbi:MAG: 50S ribosomal protein L3 [Deltaproteobacteria bacterium]|nr:50S ribosomal protein L3 [Deltaproteobacteria bacterium]
MVEGLIGKKIGMTRIFVDGVDVPVTVVQADSCHITQSKTKETDGYEAVQMGFGLKKDHRTNKAMKGHFKKSGKLNFYKLQEFSGEDLGELKPGQAIGCEDVFEVGDYVDISGTGKGKGFAGVMKRWNFKGGPAGHGSKHGRTGGAIGMCATPSRVQKGMKMAGQMGNKKVTTQNLKVVGIRKEENLLLIKGAVPGSINGMVTIKKALKKTK